MAKNYKQLMQYIALPIGFRKPSVKGDVDGNVFAVIGATTQTLRRNGHADIAKRVSEIIHDADSYHTVLATCADCVVFSSVDEEEDIDSYNDSDYDSDND